MAEYTRSRQFIYTAPNGDRKAATATYTAIYDAEKGVIYKHQLTIEPCDVVAEPQISEQIKPQIIIWNAEEYENARKVANMGPGFKNNPEDLAEFLYQETEGCAATSDLGSSTAVAASIDRMGNGSSALISNGRPSSYEDASSGRLPAESDESPSHLTATTSQVLASQANPKGWRWPDNLPPPNTRDGLLWYRNNPPPPASDPLLQGGRQYASALDDTRMARAAPNPSQADSGGDAGYGIADRTAISAPAMDAAAPNPAGLPSLRPAPTTVSTSRSIPDSTETPSIWHHIFLQVAAGGRPGRDDWES